MVRDVSHDRIAVGIVDRRPGQERQPLLLAQIDERFRHAVGHVVAVLHRHDRGDLVRTPELGFVDVAHADVSHLALVPELGDRTDRILERHLGVWPVELIDRDLVEAQPPQASFARRPQVIGPPVRGPAPRPRAFQAALRRDDEVVRVGVQRFSDQGLEDSGVRSVQ